ncbi:MAG: formylglycine-generating enzyme family protein, partial [Planctomycetaceae bacterium]|nr:formylglycine-generating enzyme family protein [Planctomycetaceae bacterium]
MKTNLRFLLLMLLTAVGCNDSTQNEQATGSTTGQPQPVPADSTVIELPSITNTLGMKLNEIPAGNFLMGSPESEAYREDDETQHKVTISKAFYMQTTEVTQGQWKAVMSTEPWKGQEYSKYIKEGANYAATHVSWDDAIAYCKKLSEKEGKKYRLPTEAEWEYACRAGTETAFSFGDNEERLSKFAWHDANARNTTHPVGQLLPNAWGLYDMHGNVWEWCSDWHGEYPIGAVTDPIGPAA